jgi:microcystin-dependent protein
MALILPNTIANGQNADGEKLQQNFAALQQHINLEVISRDGSTGMQQPLLLAGPPTETNQAATKGYVDAVGLIGEVKMWPGQTEPANFMFCRGQAVSRATYAALYAVLGTTYGAGDGSTTFTLPDYRDRSPLGAGAMFGNTLGRKEGAATSILVKHGHTMEQHTHNMSDHTHTDDHYHSGTTDNQNADHVHGMQGQQIQGTAGQTFGTHDVADWGAPVGGYFGETSGIIGNHGHTFGTNYKSQAASGVFGNKTGGPSTNTTGNSTGFNAVNAGVDESGYSNYHPVQTINFIIKVL